MQRSPRVPICWLSSSASFSFPLPLLFLILFLDTFSYHQIILEWNETITSASLSLYCRLSWIRWNVYPAACRVTHGWTLENCTEVSDWCHFLPSCRTEELNAFGHLTLRGHRWACWGSGGWVCFLLTWITHNTALHIHSLNPHNLISISIISILWMTKPNVVVWATYLKSHRLTITKPGKTLRSWFQFSHSL